MYHMISICFKTKLIKNAEMGSLEENESVNILRSQLVKLVKVKRATNKSV